ncbi:hypothetical protein SFR_2217 [Streptomyces sp. FR-008]|nr:hypothetical protein SFR_2217 [Streptomyces sp. FR-008]
MEHGAYLRESPGFHHVWRYMELITSIATERLRRGPVAPTRREEVRVPPGRTRLPHRLGPPQAPAGLRGAGLRLLPRARGGLKRRPGWNLARLRPSAAAQRWPQTPAGLEIGWADFGREWAGWCGSVARLENRRTPVGWAVGVLRSFGGAVVVRRDVGGWAPHPLQPGRHLRPLGNRHRKTTPAKSQPGRRLRPSLTGAVTTNRAPSSPAGA